MAVLIWGSGNFNRRNEETHRGTCDNCGYTGYLRCYDSSRYFSLYFIPLLPTGSNHVMDECPQCKHGKMVSAGNWKKLRREELYPALNAFSVKPEDPEVAERALVLAAQFEDLKTFKQVSQRVVEHHPDNANLLAQAGASSAYRKQNEDAIALFEAAVAVNDDPDIREALAMEHIQQGNPRLAMPMVMRVVQERGSESAGVLYLLAEGFQSVGDHDQALKLFDAYAQQFPELAEEHEKQLARSRKVSERHRSDQRPIASRNIAAGDSADPQPAGVLRRYAPMLTLPAIVLGVFVFIGILGLTMPPRHVYIVNGLNVPMDVDVDGKTYSLGPKSHRKVSNASYGSVHVSPIPGSVPFDPFTVQLSANPLSRVFNAPTFVINPDRTALLVWENAHYAELASQAKDSEIEVHYGQLMTFTGLDFRFREPPEEIELESGASAAWRQALYQLKDLSTGESMTVVRDYVGEEAVVPYLLAQVQADPDDMVTLRLLQFSLETDELLEVLEPIRARRPVLVEAHRIYQDTIEAVDPDRDIAGEYQQLFALEPDSAALAYLAGRTAHSPAEAERFFEQGAKAKTPNAYLHHGYGFQFMLHGKFAQAKQQWARATAMDPDSPLFKYQHQLMQLALGEYDALIKQTRAEIQEEEYPESEYYELIKLLAMDGQVSAARKTALARIDAISDHEEYSQEEVIYWAGIFDVVIAQVTGDPEAVKKAIREADLEAEWAFTLAALDGDWAAALQTQSGDNVPEATSCFMIYAGASRAGDTQTADAALQLAVDVYRESNYDRRMLAQWFSGEEPPPADIHLRAPMDPEELRVVLTAMAYRFPMRSEFLLQQARVMDFEPTGYHLALQPLLK